MTGRSTLCVVVQELGLSDFMWTLKRKQSSTGLLESVATSSNHFSDFDEALDAGFVALHDLRVRPSSSTGSTPKLMSSAPPRIVAPPHRISSDSPCRVPGTVGALLPPVPEQEVKKNRKAPSGFEWHGDWRRTCGTTKAGTSPR